MLILRWLPTSRSRGLALLGKLAARIDGHARAGEPLIVIGWPITRDGRKLQAGTPLLTSSQETVAVARATWVLTNVGSTR